MSRGNRFPGRKCKGLVDTGLVLVECQAKPEETQALCRECIKLGIFKTVHARMIRIRGKFLNLEGR